MAILVTRMIDFSRGPPKSFSHFQFRCESPPGWYPGWRWRRPFPRMETRMVSPKSGGDGHGHVQRGIREMGMRTAFGVGGGGRFKTPCRTSSGASARCSGPRPGLGPRVPGPWARAVSRAPGGHRPRAGPWVPGPVATNPGRHVHCSGPSPPSRNIRCTVTVWARMMPGMVQLPYERTPPGWQPGWRAWQSEQKCLLSSWPLG